MNKPENTIGVSEMENQYDKSAPCSSRCSTLREIASVVHAEILEPQPERIE